MHEQILGVSIYLIFGTAWAWFCLGVQAYCRGTRMPWWGPLANLLLWPPALVWAMLKKKTRQEAIVYLKSWRNET